MEYGIWSMEYGVWNMEYGVWSMEYGIWNNGVMECWGIISSFFHLLWLIDSFCLEIKTVETVKN